MINQGDLYWIDLREPTGSEPGYLHPHVVVQNNIFNQSKINTVVVCALSSNLKRSLSPGNVLLNKGEANLSRASVVNITQLITVNKADLQKKIGTLPRERIYEIIDGIYLLLKPLTLS